MKAFKILILMQVNQMANHDWEKSLSDRALDLSRIIPQDAIANIDW